MSGPGLKVEDTERQKIIKALIEGRLEVEKAARRLRRSVRQVYRLVAKAKKYGVDSVIHGNKGKPPANKISQEYWDEILNLARSKYPRLSNYQLQKVLLRNHRIAVGRESLRKKLRAEGITPKSKNKSGNNIDDSKKEAIRSFGQSEKTTGN